MRIEATVRAGHRQSIGTQVRDIQLEHVHCAVLFEMTVRAGQRQSIGSFGRTSVWADKSVHEDLMQTVNEIQS